MGLDGQAQVLGVMTTMGESSLKNLTYGDYERGGVTNPDGSRTTSIGLFQQQDSWGSREDRLNPTKAATMFYERLVRVDGWQNMPPSRAINRVQINSDPDHYTKWLAPAVAVASALTVPCQGQANYDPPKGAAPGPWGGYENGRIGESQLAPLPWAPDERLRVDAAQALTALNNAFRQTFGPSFLSAYGAGSPHARVGPKSRLRRSTQTLRPVRNQSAVRTQRGRQRRHRTSHR